MNDFRGKTAVVTGAASGIGFALAERFAAEGMNVVLADIETPALDAAERALRAKGAATLAVQTDVADAAQVEALADRAFAAFGSVHVLCNNAGVGHGEPKPMFRYSAEDWRWLMGINLFGVVHGVRSFVPRMAAQPCESWVVNTASITGLLATVPMLGPYAVSKHAVVALSEGLFAELSLLEQPVKVAVLCPAWVSTRIADGERNRPGAAPASDSDLARRIRESVAGGTSPSGIADAVVQAIREDRFYVLPHPETQAGVRRRFEGIAAGRPAVRPIG
jgi:NAD(P)-dependent dehydrogenase (short-subunit alcohol dehydrogenase family)